MLDNYIMPIYFSKILTKTLKNDILQINFVNNTKNH